MHTILLLSDTIGALNNEFAQNNSLTFVNDSNTSLLCLNNIPKHETKNPIIPLLGSWLLGQCTIGC
jgi:hypothetical protein